MSRLPSLRPLALVAAIGAITLAFGQGEAAAEADAAGEVRALQAQVKLLSARVDALDAMLSKQGTRVTLEGDNANRELVLRTDPRNTRAVTLGRDTAVLSFKSITLSGDAVTIKARRSIELEAPQIIMNGEVTAKGGNELILKGSKVRSN